MAEADLLAARVTYTGTHEGTMRGVAPTGRVLTWSAMTFRRFDEEGGVVERWIIGDYPAPPHQLGPVGATNDTSPRGGKDIASFRFGTHM